MSPPDERCDATQPDAILAYVAAALPFFAELSRSAVDEEYASLASAWRSTGLWEGSADQLSAVLKRNLDRDRQQPRFEAFSAKRLTTPHSIQVYSNLAAPPGNRHGVSLPYRVWRGNGIVYLAGHGDMLR